MPIERKLAAIMFTDIVGYTAQMSKDEASAINLVNNKLSILKPLLTKFKGTYVKSIGDGTLSYFNSAVDAVHCATTFQESIYENKKLNIRIGVHLGDTIIENGDIRGDGVNIASRLESMAVEGSIFISKEVHDQLINQKKFQSTSIGLQSMKGVGRIIEVFTLKGKKLKQPNPNDYNNSKINIKNSTEVPLLTLIPFRNKGKDEDEFYSYSISAAILSRISTSSNIIISSMEEVEKLAKDLSSKEIIKKLKTQYSLTGSLWKKDNMFNLSIELIDGKTNQIIWTNSWLENWENLPNIETYISNNIIKILDKKSMDRIEKQAFTFNRKTVIDSEAYRIYLKGKYIYENRSDDVDISKSKNLFKKSINLDENLIYPRMMLGEMFYNLGEYNKSLKIFFNNLKMSIIINDLENMANTLSYIANIYYQKGDYDKSLDYNKQGLKIRRKTKNNLGISQSLNSIGAIYDALQDYSEAITYYKKSINVSKKSNDKKGLVKATLNISNIYNTLSNYNRALKTQQECIKLCKGINDYSLLAYAYNLLGVILSNMHNYKKSVFYLKKCLKIRRALFEPEGISSALKSIGVLYYHQGKYRQALIYHKKALLERENIGYLWGIGESNSYLAITYKKMGEYKNAIEKYEKAYQVMDSLKNYEQVSIILNSLGNIYRKMGEYDLAFKTLKKSENIKRDIQDLDNLGYVFLEISSVYRWKGDYKLALEYNQKSTNIAKSNKQLKLLANNYYHKSLMLITSNNLKGAKEHIDKSIKIAKQSNYLSNLAKYLDCLAIIYRIKKQYKKANSIVNKSLLICKNLEDTHGERKYLNSIGLIKEYRADYTGALNIYIKCLQLSTEMSEKRSIAVSHNNIGCVYECLNNWELSIKHFKKALKYAKRINYQEGISAYNFNLAYNSSFSKKYKKAIQYIDISIGDKNYDHNDQFIISCYILRTYILCKMKDIVKASLLFDRIKDINKENSLGTERNWELYEIYNTLDLDGKAFLNQSYKTLCNELKCISSKENKLFYKNNVRYNKLILENWKSI